MSDQNGHFHRIALDGISQRLGVGVVVCDASGDVQWRSDGFGRNLPRDVKPGENFEVFLRSLEAETGHRAEALSLSSSSEPSGKVYRVRGDAGDDSYFRLLSFTHRGPRDEEQIHEQVHYLVDETREKQLEASFVDHLQQLTSMKEIIDTLYNSVDTQEVIYLILVAVTSQMGFGFNRAFYLEAQGSQLRGLLGIGPSSIEDAHRIWSRLAELNLPNLRATYDDLIKRSEPPDPLTQKLAAGMCFPLDQDSGLQETIRSHRPAVLNQQEGGPKIDEEIYSLLGADSIAMVPLFVRGKLAGVLLADNFITRQPIRDEALDLLGTFSGYAGLALERSQLYEELRDTIEKLRGANDRLRRNQQRLLQAEKLSAVGELAAIVSHEIRNPLVGIGGLARGLLRDKSLGSSQHENVQTIVNEVTRLERFLRETLDYVKPVVEDTSPVDVSAAFDDCLGAFRSQAEHRGIEVEVSVPEEVRVLANADLLHRILANLIKNSIEALGTVDTESRIRLSAERDQYSGRISIADTGPGIPEETRSRVFDPFYTTKSEGTGLGLAIASQGVRSLGGQISLQESTEFRTIFSITLPLAEAAQAARAKLIAGKGTI